MPNENGPQHPGNARRDQQEVRTLLTRAYQALRAREPESELTNFHNELVDFSERLKTKYPNYLQYRIYHALVGSTIIEDPANIEEDFPGDDSVVNFVKKLIQKYTS